MDSSKLGYPKPIVLKSGQQLWLRPLNPREDEKRLFEFFERIPPRTRWYMENNVANPEIVRHYLLNYHPERAVPIIAVDEQGRIAGKATMNLYHRNSARGHVGRVRLVLDPAFRNQRLGTYLLLDMIQLAVDLELGLIMVEFVRGVEDNAIRAARRLDFFEQAVIPDFAKDPRGNYYDLVIMIKRIHRGYEDF